MGKPQVTLTIAGDSSSAEKAFDRVGDAANEMSREVGNSTDGFQRAEGAADTLDTRAAGLADTLGGVSGTMEGGALIAQGDYMAGFEKLGGGLSDFGDGLGGLVIPAIQSTATAMMGGAKKAVVAAGSWVASSTAMSVSMVKTAATTVASWAVMGAQSLLGAAKVALAWLIAMGPIILIVAAVIGLVALIIMNWDTIWNYTKMVFTAVWDFLKGIWDTIVGAIGAYIDFIKNIFFNFVPLGIFIKNWEPIKAWLGEMWENVKGFVSGAFDFIKNIFFNFTPLGIIIKNWGAVSGWIKDNLNSLISWIGGLPGRVTNAAFGLFDGFRDAFRAGMNWIIDKWNGLSFTFPSFTAFGKTIGGGTLSTLNLPRFHQGGIVQGARGQEVLAILQAGEQVVPTGKVGDGSIVSLVINSGGSKMDDLLVELLSRAVRVRGGNVQLVLGGARG